MENYQNMLILQSKDCTYIHIYIYIYIYLYIYIYVYIYTRFTNSTESFIQLAECVLKNNPPYVIAFLGNMGKIFFSDSVI